MAMNPFKIPRLFVELTPNQVCITYMDNPQQYSFSSPKPFSTPRLLLADFTVFEEFLKENIYKISPAGIFGYRPPTKIILQIKDSNYLPISPTELRAYKDSLEHAGAKWIAVIEHVQEMSYTDKLDEFKKNKF